MDFFSEVEEDEVAESFEDEESSTLVVLNCVSLTISLLFCFYSWRVKS